MKNKYWYNVIFSQKIKAQIKIVIIGYAFHILADIQVSPPCRLFAYIRTHDNQNNPTRNGYITAYEKLIDSWKIRNNSPKIIACPPEISNHNTIKGSCLAGFTIKKS